MSNCRLSGFYHRDDKRGASWTYRGSRSWRPKSISGFYKGNTIINLKDTFRVKCIKHFLRLHFITWDWKQSIRRIRREANSLSLSVTRWWYRSYERRIICRSKEPPTARCCTTGTYRRICRRCVPHVRMCIRLSRESFFIILRFALWNKLWIILCEV